MKSLVLKDIINLKNQLKFVLIFIILYSILFSVVHADNSSGSELYSYMSSITALMVVLYNMQLITSFSWDEYFKWDRYAVCLPVSRTEIVMSKYILLILLSLLGTCLSFILTLGISIIKGYSIFECLSALLNIVCTVVPVGLTITALVIPLIYKFGVEKGRLVILTAFLTATLVFVLITKKFDSLNLSLNNLKYSIIAMPVLSIVVLLISFKISCGIYKNKEL